MRILITNFHLQDRSGTELFVRELSLHLRREGHEVWVLAFLVGGLAAEIRDAGIVVTSDPREVAGIAFDVIHAQHNVTAIWARALFPHTPMLYWCHGPLPDLEQPPSLDIGINRFVAGSEEIRDHLVSTHHVPPDRIELFRTTVDLCRFYPRWSARERPRKLLAMSNHLSDGAWRVIQEAAGSLGVAVARIGMPDRIVADPALHIADADLVITLGRGVLEALACGRNALVFDSCGGDGLVDEESFHILRRKNFSGRTAARRFTAAELALEIERYDRGIPERLRACIEQEHSLGALVPKLLPLYASVALEGAQAGSLPSRGLARELGVLRDHCVGQLEHLGNRVERLEEIVRWMESSRFWKLRNRYMRLKGVDTTSPLGPTPEPRTQPEAIFVQLTTACNATCVNCPHERTYGRKGKHRKGHMSDAVWTKLVQEVGRMGFSGQVGLYLHHEPLLDRRLFDRIAQINRETSAFVVISTNGALLTPDNRRRLIEARPRQVHLNINSADPAQYESMTGLEFDDVIENCHAFIREAEGVIAVEVNCPVLPGVDVTRLQALFPGTRVNAEFAANSRGGLLPDISSAGKGSRFRLAPYCTQPLQNLNVLWDGSVVLCCMDWAHESKRFLPNILAAGLGDIYNGPFLRRVMQEFRAGNYQRFKMCRHCSREMGFEVAGRNQRLPRLLAMVGAAAAQILPERHAK